MASLINDGIEAYDDGRYMDALDVYQAALKTPGGDQLRVHNGIYLANQKLRRTKSAMTAFGKVVDYGLKSEKLSVKFFFKPGSTQFATDQKTRAPYNAWLDKIAERTAAEPGLPRSDRPHRARRVWRRSTIACQACAPTTSRIGSKTNSARLRGRLISTGKGSREMLVGTGKDDASDALDRRVEFKTVKCGSDGRPV